MTSRDICIRGNELSAKNRFPEVTCEQRVSVPLHGWTLTVLPHALCSHEPSEYFSTSHFGCDQSKMLRRRSALKMANDHHSSFFDPFFSITISSCLISMSGENPPIPSAATIRWQGTTSGVGLCAIARPTTRGDVPTRAAICP